MRLLGIAALLFVATPLSPQTPQTMDGALPAGFYFVSSPFQENVLQPTTPVYVQSLDGDLFYVRYANLPSSDQPSAAQVALPGLTAEAALIDASPGGRYEITHLDGSRVLVKILPVPGTFYLSTAWFLADAQRMKAEMDSVRDCLPKSQVPNATFSGCMPVPK
jgi:hypothetical protein